MNSSNIPKITIVIATLNGESTIYDTINSMLNINKDGSNVEIVVVNNGSIDSTLEVLYNIKDLYKNNEIKIINEKRKGKNIALNSAIPHCSGEIFIFSDDDIIFQKDWYDVLCNAYQKFPDIEIFGGPIKPYFDIEHASQLDILNDMQEKHRSILYAELLPLSESSEVSPLKIFGGNMSVRRSVFDRGFRYREDIGPDGTKKYRMGSETSFLKECDAAGIRAYFINDNAVQHIVPKEHLRRSWIFSRAVRYGRAIAFNMLSNEDYSKISLFFGVPRYLFRMLINNGGAYLWGLVSFDSVARFEAKWSFFENIGKIKEFLSARE